MVNWNESEATREDGPEVVPTVVDDESEPEVFDEDFADDGAGVVVPDANPMAPVMALAATCPRFEAPLSADLNVQLTLPLVGYTPA